MRAEWEFTGWSYLGGEYATGKKAHYFIRGRAFCNWGLKPRGFEILSDHCRVCQKHLSQQAHTPAPAQAGRED